MWGSVLLTFLQQTVLLFNHILKWGREERICYLPALDLSSSNATVYPLGPVLGAQNFTSYHFYFMHSDHFSGSEELGTKRGGWSYLIQHPAIMNHCAVKCRTSCQKCTHMSEVVKYFCVLYSRCRTYATADQKSHTVISCSDSPGRNQGYSSCDWCL